MQNLKPEDLQSNKRVIVFGADYCPYCVKAKTILTQEKIDFEYRDIQKSQEFENQRAGLENNLKYDTIPMIFIDNKFIGGCSDLQEIEANGQLKKLLA